MAARLTSWLAKANRQACTPAMPGIYQPVIAGGLRVLASFGVVPRIGWGLSLTPLVTSAVQRAARIPGCSSEELLTVWPWNC